jgi:hypothetical protein
MPSLPNPYGPVSQFGEGVRSLSNAAISMGRAGGMGRYNRARTEQQNAEDAAQAEKALADQRYSDAKTTEQIQKNLAASPEGAAEFGRTVSGLPMGVFKRALDMQQQGGLPEGPIPEYGDISPATIESASQGNLARLKYQADPGTSLDEIFKAMDTRGKTQDYNRVIAGTLPAGRYGEAVAGSKGNELYGLGDGTQFNKFRKGDFVTTPVGKSTISKNNAAAGASGAQTKKTQAETVNLGKGFFGPSVTVDVNGVPTPKFQGQVAEMPGVRQVPVPKEFAPKGGKDGKGGGSRKLINGTEVKAMQSQLSDLAGTSWENIDPGTRASFTDRASEFLLDPDSEHYRNPAGAMTAAVQEQTLEPFEDTSGYFSSANYRPKGGGRTTTARTGTTAPKTGLPQEAMASLKEGETTTFRNGQTWSLQNGQPVQVR